MVVCVVILVYNRDLFISFSQTSGRFGFVFPFYPKLVF